LRSAPRRNGCHDAIDRSAEGPRGIPAPEAPRRQLREASRGRVTDQSCSQARCPDRARIPCFASSDRALRKFRSRFERHMYGRFRSAAQDRK
jgi:hypothetical protein